MKFVCAFILLIALIVQTGSRFVVVLDYEWNKAYIAKTLCENRNKPRVCCRGKCYLKKQLAKADKEQNMPGNKSGKNKEEQLFVYSAKNTNHFLVAVYNQSNYPPFNNDHIPDDLLLQVFRPPQV
jgi:hypothetical protein